MPLTPRQATVNPHLCQRLSNIHKQVCLGLLWGHCSFHMSPGAHKLLFVQFSCSVMFDSLQPHGLHAACHASLSITTSQSLLKLMSIELVMPSNYLILCHPLLYLPSVFPSIRDFSSWLFASCGQSFGASASASVLPMNIQD